MSREKKPSTEEEIYEEKHGKEALEKLLEEIEEFPELDDYIDEDIFEMDDEDFYIVGNK